MEWLNLPTRTYSESLRKLLLRIKGIGILHWILHSGVIDQLPRISLGTSPYFLVYGKEAILPPNIYLPSLQLAQSSHGRYSNFLQTRIDTLLKLKEERDKAKEKFHIHQQRIKRWFDKHVASDKQFQVGDLVLKWDKTNKAKGKHSKFQNLCLGSYEIAEKIGDATYKLQSLQGDLENLPINASILKRYFS